MKPFNLEEALAGRKVVLRNGDYAIVAAYNPNADKECALIGWYDGESLSWFLEGNFSANGIGERFDIVGMAPTIETRTGYLNVYMRRTADTLHITQESADRHAGIDRINCIPITYQVEVME